MIDLMKRLTELDAANPNRPEYSSVSEGTGEQLNEFAWVLPLLARLGPALATAGRAIASKTPGAMTATGRAAAPVAGAVARQSPAIAGGAAIYDLYSTVKEKLGLNDKTANQTFSDEDSLMNTIKKFLGPMGGQAENALRAIADFAIKNALPLAVIIGLLYGGKQLLNMVTKEELAEGDELLDLMKLSGTKSVNECGMSMPSGYSMDRPSTPASINMSAGSGEELTSIIQAIASLAGGHKDSDEIVTGDPTPKDSMRSVLDKLNPMDDEETEEGLVGAGVGGMAGGALGKAGGAALGTALGGPIGGAVGGLAGNVLGTAIGSRAGDEYTGEEYDNTPMDPTDTNEFDAEQHAHHENPPGADRRGNANNPRAYDTNESIAVRLMSEYQQFMKEN